MLRKRAWYAEGYYDVLDSQEMKIDHIDHCINSIRQSLMCSSDVTPIPWAWSEKDQQLLPVATGIHKCRDFEAVREWASQRLIENFDMEAHVIHTGNS